jgi:DNA-binding response OmpR family regulator
MPRRVVAVDDDADLLGLFATVLTDAGYEVVGAPDATTALAALRSTAPAAVILDIRLDTPNRGWHILDEMRADLATAHIPVIVSTADAQALQEHAAGLHGGGYAMLAKPFDLNELLSLVRQLAGPPDAA